MIGQQPNSKCEFTCEVEYALDRSGCGVAHSLISDRAIYKRQICIHNEIFNSTHQCVKIVPFTAQVFVLVKALR